MSGVRCALGVALAGTICLALSSAASAELPEIGRCIKQANKTYAYANKSCTKKSAGESTGSYEWVGGAGPKGGLTVGGETSVLESTQGKKLSCFVGTTGAGQVTSATGLALPSGLSWEECELYNGSNTFSCKRSEQPSGTLQTAPLEATLGLVRGSAAGFDLRPGVPAEPFLEVNCFGGHVSLGGSAISQIKTANKMATRVDFSFLDRRGVQKVTSFLGGEPDTLEWHEGGTEAPGAMGFIGYLQFEEPMEIRTK